MNEEEKFLKSHFGNENHFIVPDGYFEKFSDQLMEHLPEQEVRLISLRPSVWRQFRSTILAAACIAGFIFSFGIYHYTTRNETAEVVAHTEALGYNDFDEVADYMMLDNEDIYAMLTN